MHELAGVYVDILAFLSRKGLDVDGHSFYIDSIVISEFATPIVCSIESLQKTNFISTGRRKALALFETIELETSPSVYQRVKFFADGVPFYTVL